MRTPNKVAGISFTPPQDRILKFSVGVRGRHRAVKLAGLSRNEEVVKEALLLDLEVNFPCDVKFLPFNKIREAGIGPDCF